MADVSLAWWCAQPAAAAKQQKANINAAIIVTISPTMSVLSPFSLPDTCNILHKVSEHPQSYCDNRAQQG